MIFTLVEGQRRRKYLWLKNWKSSYVSVIHVDVSPLVFLFWHVPLL